MCKRVITSVCVLDVFKNRLFAVLRGNDLAVIRDISVDFGKRTGVCLVVSSGLPSCTTLADHFFDDLNSFVHYALDCA
ncbi:MAG: uncharacterized protein KVP18_003774 [Porospora cf. gigantea A]|uniref:uncharacterized protein n=1 Tax=Porospora cf. gigantea A TaxID=2853593 RepID=UPI00355A6E91|nr:MAG: hypothetical protein KVP18_003774 [Porospora cf. gigantea A]